MAKQRGQEDGTKRDYSSKGISAARLHQKAGAGNAFDGYAKVDNGNGVFRMKKTAGGK